MQTIDHWLEWKDKCALGLCGPETRSALHAFARARFYRFAASCAHAVNVRDPDVLTPDPPEAWHCFETYLRLHNDRRGKAYKEWLFSRAAGSPTLDRIQGGASLLMRDVVRERLRREFSHSCMVELDAGTGRRDGEFTPGLCDLLPADLDTAADVESRELEALAAADAEDVLAALAWREKVALLAKEIGLSLVQPAVVKAARCGKNLLCKAYFSALAVLASHVRSKHPQEDDDTLAFMSVLVFRHTKTLILSWGRGEKEVSQLFSILDRQMPHEADGRSGDNAPK